MIEEAWEWFYIGYIGTRGLFERSGVCKPRLSAAAATGTTEDYLQCWMSRPVSKAASLYLFLFSLDLKGFVLTFKRVNVVSWTAGVKEDVGTSRNLIYCNLECCVYTASLKGNDLWGFDSKMS